ncbi:MAG TPA: hypothetical protein VMY99_04530 [Nevskiaceae bacterium]|nr:hypothetical protein [Nevskiaceae bacterium]
MLVPEQAFSPSAVAEQNIFFKTTRAVAAMALAATVGVAGCGGDTPPASTSIIDCVNHPENVEVTPELARSARNGTELTFNTASGQSLGKGAVRYILHAQEAPLPKTPAHPVLNPYKYTPGDVIKRYGPKKEGYLIAGKPKAGNLSHWTDSANNVTASCRPPVRKSK